MITDDAPSSPQTIALSASVNPAFAISPSSPGSNSVTVTAGQTAAFNLQLTPGPGFAGSASFACSGAPAQATCSAPNAQFAGGAPISYVVSVATTRSTMMVPLQLPPFISLHVFFVVACCMAFAAFAYSYRLRPLSGFTRAASLITLVVCLVQFTGCGGGVAGVTPQVVPTPHVIGTPPGTSVITVKPSVITSTGVALQGVPPIQLTLIVQ
jgi:hypothetical protein